ncbi:MAG: hypothetical protein JWR22_3929 [Herminiimonas sp.]|nr:hypothetical protein [Herminiimonas sp.]
MLYTAICRPDSMTCVIYSNVGGSGTYSALTFT